jgi:cytochrome P450
MEETPNNGIIYLRGFFGSEQLLLTSPAALADILSNKAYNFEKPEGDRDFLRRILGSGLITAEGNVHKHQRKQVTPSFSSKQIRNLYPLFWEKSILLTRLVSEELDDSVIDNDSPSISGEIDISKWSQRVSLDIISKAGFDWELDTLRCPDNDMARSFEQIFAVSVENVILFAVSVYGPEWMLEFIPGGISSRFRAATGTLRQLCRVFIQNKQTEIKADWEGSFDILSQLGKRPDVTEELLVNQCLTFLTAG